MMAVASFCDMLSPFCVCPFHRIIAAELALPSLVAQLVETVIHAVRGRG
jgi:hypothetical protein